MTDIAQALIQAQQPQQAPQGQVFQPVPVQPAQVAQIPPGVPAQPQTCLLYTSPSPRDS